MEYSFYCCFNQKATFWLSVGFILVRKAKDVSENVHVFLYIQLILKIGLM